MTEEEEELTIKFSPEVMAKMEKDPKIAAAIRACCADMRQAHAAVASGQYASFDEAMEAITGRRPQLVERGNLDDIDDPFRGG